jgi:hypothetical protein
MEMFDRWDIVNLGDVLPDECIEELLTEIIATSVPSLRMNFTDSMELLRLSLFFGLGLLELGVTLGIIFYTKVDPHESGDTNDKRDSLSETYDLIAGKSLTGGVPDKTHL